LLGVPAGAMIIRGCRSVDSPEKREPLLSVRLVGPHSAGFLERLA